MALSKAGGGSGLSGTLSTNPTIRQQQLICDPDEPQAGSTSVAYEASQVTVRGAQPGPGYDNRSFTGFVEVVDQTGKPVLQPLQEFIERPLGRETGYVQILYQLDGIAGQMRPPDGFTIVDEEGVAGVDTHALTFALLPGVPTDAFIRYVVFSAGENTHADNKEDFFIDPTGKRIGSAEIAPAAVSTKPGGGPLLLVGDSRLVEGDNGSAEMVFSVLLTQPVNAMVTVDVATADGTATVADDDYKAVGGTLKFEAGQTSLLVGVPIIGDLRPEEDETLSLNLSNAIGGATIARARGFGTIVDDDRNRPAPTVSVGDVAVVEPDTGNVGASFPLRLSGPSFAPVTVQFTTADHTALASFDYARTQGSVTFAPGQTLLNVTVPVLGDTVDESDETFFLNLIGVTGATLADAQGVGTVIEDDDRPPTVTIDDVQPDPRTTAIDAATIRFSEPVSGFDIGDLALLRDGVVVPFGRSQILTSDGNVWTLSGLGGITADAGVYELRLAGGGASAIVDAGGNPLAGGASEQWQVIPPGVPPVVTQVFVGSTAWTATFKNFLAGQRIGDATFGYAVPAGAAQLDELPWGNLDQVSIRFDKPTLALDTDLAVRGVNVPDYPIGSYDYDEATNTATWTLDRSVRNDKLMLDLSGGHDGVVDGAGVPLDGDWVNGADAYPSGDGAPAGDLRFRLNVLPGDANRDGRVNAIDWFDLLRRRPRSAANPGSGQFIYTAFYDLSGDGALGVQDLLLIRRNLATILPATEPAGSAAPAPQAASAPQSSSAALRAALALRAARGGPVIGSITRDLFGATPIL